MRIFLSGLLAICLLSACGHKGPLYLPTAEDGNRTSSQEADKK